MSLFVHLFSQVFDLFLFSFQFWRCVYAIFMLHWSTLRTMFVVFDNKKKLIRWQLNWKLSGMVNALAFRWLIEHIPKQSKLSKVKLYIRLGQTTSRAIHAFLKSVIDCLDSKRYLAGISCYTSWTFYRINDEILKRIDEYAIRGIFFDWFR